MVRVASQPSFPVRSDAVEAFVTEVGGHLGPVRIRCGGRDIEPYSVAPWHAEPHPAISPMLRVLRGDFFCLPFGGNDAPFGEERHPPHGETANAVWRLERAEEDRLVLSLDTTIRPGRVIKTVSLRPGAFEDPRLGGYSSLVPGAVFERLDAVPSLFGNADLSRYPAREGFEDLVMLVGDPTADLGWSTLALPDEGYLWFALRDPSILANTVLWHSNGGRHYAPWNGRHRGVLGIEDVTAYFHEGLGSSAAPNPVAERGGKTCLDLRPESPTTVRTIQGVAEIPPGFAGVRTALWADDGVVFEDGRGHRARTNLDVTFLRGRD